MRFYAGKPGFEEYWLDINKAHSDRDSQDRAWLLQINCRGMDSAKQFTVGEIRRLRNYLNSHLPEEKFQSEM